MKTIIYGNCFFSQHKSSAPKLNTFDLTALTKSTLKKSAKFSYKVWEYNMYEIIMMLPSKITRGLKNQDGSQTAKGFIPYFADQMMYNIVRIKKRRLWPVC